MHNKIDYSKSPAPSADAMADVIDWLGQAKYDSITGEMAKVLDPRQFAFLAGIAGIQGFPVRAWYDHYHGAGAWNKAYRQPSAAAKQEDC